MNYKRIIENLKYISQTHLLVNSCFEGDNIYKINNMDVLYPIVFITPQPHQMSNPISTYNFIIYYVDRLLEDQTNRVDIHNAALKTLNDIVFEIDDLDNTESKKPINTTVFSEKFTDECSGGFIEISIETYNDNTDCNSLMDSVVVMETEDNNLILTEENINIQIEDGE